MTKKLKRSIFFILFVISLTFASSPVLAKESIQVKANIGYDRTVKTGRGVPVHIKLENKGEDFSGDLLINFAPAYNAGGSKILHVHIPAGSTKSYSVSIPGFSDEVGFSNNNTAFIHLFKGDWQDGHEVKVSTEAFSIPRILSSDSTTIGLLSENTDRLKELKVLQLNNGSSQSFTLSKDNFPNDSAGLEFFNFIVVDEFAISTLDNKQQDALLGWIKNGGVLIAGANPNGNQAFGSIQSSMPLDINDEITVHDLSFLKGSEKPSFNSLSIFTGNVQKDAVATAYSESHPVVAQKSLGNGSIWQTAFSLGDAPLSSWNGYDEWFSTLLDKADNTALREMFKDDNFYSNIMYQIGDVNDLFPSSYFSIGILILILVCYFIIVVPILYFVLRKIDKREHAWWLIPALSLLFSTGIFAAGAKDRIAAPHMNEIGAYKANGDGSLYGLYAATLMSNTGGDYKIVYPNQELNAIPFYRNSVVNSPQMYKQATIESKQMNQELTFPNVEFWSTRSLFGFAHKDGVGGFRANLDLQDGKLTGTIKNEFPYSFEDLYVWSGTNTYDLGAVKKGETLNVTKEVNVPFLSAMQYVDGMFYQQNINRLQASNIQPMKEEVLKMLAGKLNNSQINNPVIVGITKDEVIKTNIVDKKEKKEKLSLIYQPFKVNTALRGPFTLDTDQLAMNIKVLKGNIMDRNTGKKNYIVLDDGEYELNYQIPQQLNPGKTNINEIKFVLEANAYTTYSVFDFKANKYVKLNPQNRVVELKDHPQRFVLDNKIKVKLEKNGNEHPDVNLPQLTLKGDVRP